MLVALMLASPVVGLLASECLDRVRRDLALADEYRANDELMRWHAAHAVITSRPSRHNHND